MSGVRLVDRLIAVGLVGALVALLILALVDRSDTPRAEALAGHTTRPEGSDNPAVTPIVRPSAVQSSLPATTAPSTTSTAPSATTTSNPPLVPGPVTAVGDSILLDIQPYLATDIPGANIDGLVSRQFDTGIGVVQADRASATLGTVLIVELGTNGAITATDFDAMMAAASGVKRVVFVNENVPRPWEIADNAVLAAGVARYPGVAVLADWNTLSSGHPEWFTPDHVHLEPAGAQALAQLVAADA